MALDVVIKDLELAFKKQDDKKCSELTQKALDEGGQPADLLSKLLQWTKDICSKTFYSASNLTDEQKANWKPEEAIMLTDLMMIAECLTGSVKVLKPALAEKAVKVAQPGTIVIGTVEGDVHDIGKTLVADMYAVAGYKVKDLGFDVSAKKFILAAKINKADIVAISCSMSMSRMVVKEIVEGLKEIGLRDRLMIITGGQAAFPSDVETYGVNAYGADVGGALSQGEELMRMLNEKRAKK